MSTSQSIQTQTAALRKALQNVLFAVEAMSADTSWERAAREEKRQRVVRLLSELSPPAADHAETHLVSPPLDPDTLAEAPVLKDDAHTTAATHTDSVNGFPLPEHRLLGNVFSRPAPLQPSTQIVRVGQSGPTHDATRTAPHYLADDCPAPQPTVSDARRLSAAGHLMSRQTASLRRNGERPAAPAPRRSSPRSENGTLSTDPSSFDYYDASRGNQGADTDDPSRRYDRDGEGRLVGEDEYGRMVRLTRTSLPSPRRNVCLYDYACVTPSFWIYVWPCFGTAVCRTSRPTRVLVRGCYRYFEDVVERAAAQTRCQPACPSLYTPDGYPVRELEMLVAEQHYLLFPSGGFYRKKAVPNALLWLLYKDARQIVQCA